MAIGAGVAAHSLALTAFGADSVIELVTGGVLLALLALAGYIVVASVVKLVTHKGAETSYLGLG